MITVEKALEILFHLAKPMATQVVPLEQAHKRILAKGVIAQRDQPPFSSSAMDGYAISDTVSYTHLTLPTRDDV